MSNINYGSLFGWGEVKASYIETERIVLKNTIICDMLLVGGGGGGGNAAPNAVPSFGGGGGGGGQVVSVANLMLAPGTSYGVTIGSGGGTFGSPTSFSVITTVATYRAIEALGGGGGGNGANTYTALVPGKSGGCGGGPGSVPSTNLQVAVGGVSAGFSDSYFNFFDVFTRIRSRGTDGRTTYNPAVTTGSPGGGALGFTGSESNGFTSTLTGSAVVYSTGGSASGGAGSATANTGNGGPGGQWPAGGGGNGGSGAFIIRWDSKYGAAKSYTGDVTEIITPGYFTYQFNGSGTITVK